MPTAVWFAGTDGRDDDERAFLLELRRLVASWPDGDLQAEDTHAEIVLAPLFLAVSVPGAPELRDELQLGYWTGAERWLEGAWAGGAYLLDDHDGNSAECLTVRGTRSTPQEFARFAAEWIRLQLDRSVIREEWIRRGEVVATTWRLSDTKRVLAREGSNVPRLLRRPPDRVLVVRGRASV